MKLYHYTIRLFVTVLCLFIVNCGNTNTDKNTAQTNLTNDQKNKLLQEKDSEARSNKFGESYGSSIWYFSEYDKPSFYKHSSGDTVHGIISELNTLLKKDEAPSIILNKIEKNVAYVRVSDDEYLTQRMGSFGARSYLNVVTYSLASLKNIDCVYFDFDIGDHAVPGKYCK